MNLKRENTLSPADVYNRACILRECIRNRADRCTALLCDGCGWTSQRKRKYAAGKDGGKRLPKIRRRRLHRNRGGLSGLPF